MLHNSRLGFRVKDKARLGLGLVLGIALVLRFGDILIGLAHFTFCHTSSPQKGSH